MPRLLAIASLLICSLIVGWVHLLPLQLHGVEAPAAQVARLQVRMRLAQESGPQIKPRELEAQTEQWVRAHPSELAAMQAKLVEQYQDALRFTAGDGRSYVYLGDEDSYAWLRLAQNVLQHGTTCDAVEAGECRDTYVNAPLGATLLYRRSLHISTIALLQRLIAVFEPQYPLSAASFWVPVILAMLGVWPAYWMGARLAGPVAGIGAALLTALHPYLLYRTIGSDNDIWNVVLPLYMNAAVMKACDARKRTTQMLWAVAGGIFAVLHAITWRGWVFTYVIVLVALLGAAFMSAAADWLRKRRPLREVVSAPRAERRRRGERVTSAAAAAPPAVPSTQTTTGLLVVALVFYLTTGISVTLTTPDESYWTLPLRLPQIVLDTQTQHANVVEKGVWPDVMNTVSELQQSSFADLSGWGERGQVYFLVALVGLLVALVPLRPLTGARLAVLLGGSALFSITMLVGNRGPFATTLITALPFACAAWLRAASPQTKDRDDLGPLSMIALWFVVGIFVVFRGSRFILLLTPGLGIAMGIGVGRLHQLLSGVLGRWSAATQRGWSFAWGLVLCLLYVAPSAAGYVAARDYLPAMNDAWWDSLLALRQRAAPDAIVNAWWDYGYWVKYVADRRVTADGSMLLTHLPYWLGRVLVSGSERQSVGLLRMLSCGSDATPLPEGAAGAYGLLQAKLHDAIRAQALLVELAERNREQAAAVLQEQGFSPAEQNAILARTHCKPPETYMLIGSDLTRKDSWMRMAAWDFRRAYIADQVRRRPQAVVLADLRQRFGYSEAEAQALYDEARAKRSVDFVIGPAPRAPSIWYPCQPGGSTGITRCPLGLFDLSTKTVLEEFDFNPAHPQASVLRHRYAEPGHQPGAPAVDAPAALIVADAQMQEIDLPSSRYQGAAILMDARNARILIGPAQLIRSTFTHLLFLNGRYAQFYEKVDERVAYNEDHLQTWKVNFPED